MIGNEADARCLREVEAHYSISIDELPMDFMAHLAGEMDEA